MRLKTKYFLRGHVTSDQCGQIQLCHNTWHGPFKILTMAKRKQSFVWNCFTVSTENENEVVQVVCNECKLKYLFYSFTATTNEAREKRLNGCGTSRRNGPNSNANTFLTELSPLSTEQRPFRQKMHKKRTEKEGRGVTCLKGKYGDLVPII